MVFINWLNDNYELIIDSFDITDWDKIVNAFACNPYVEQWESKRVMDYRYNYSIKSGDSSIYLGYWHNTQVGRNMDMHALKIKFNFNKVRGDMFDWLCVNVLHDNLDRLRVVSVDMCLDVRSSIRCFMVDKGRKKNVRSFNDTMYFGDRHKNGAVKIYDKGKELGSDEVLTRYEVTIKPDGYYLPSKLFDATYSLVDTMVIDSFQLGFELDPVDRMVITSIMNGDGSIDELNRRYKKKIKDIMDKMTSFRINDDCIPDINAGVVSCSGRLVKYINSVYDVKSFGNNELPF